MSCIICYQAKNLPRCLNTIDIGTIADLNTAVIVRVKSSTGRIEYFNTTSDGSGNVIVDVTGFDFAEMVYEISVLKASDNTVLTITTPGGDDTLCIEVGFEMGDATATTIEAR